MRFVRTSIEYLSSISFKLLLFAILISFPLRAVQAQGMPVFDTLVNLQLQLMRLDTLQKNIDEAMREAIKKSLTVQIFSYLTNLTAYAADSLAYEAATAIASGGVAESPLYDGTPIGIFFKQWSASVAGEALGLLQEDLAASGALGGVFKNFNLCAPSVDVTISLQLGIKGVFDGFPPKCDIKAVQANWRGFQADIADEDTGANNKNKMILTQLADAFDPQTNEFSVGVSIQSSILNKAQEDAFLKAGQMINTHGYSGVVDMITGQTLTPANWLENNFMDRVVKSSEGGFETMDVLRQTDSALLAVGMHAASVFSNTLLSEATKKIYEGFFNFDIPSTDPFGDIENIALTNADSARDQFRSLLAFTPLEVTNYSILSEFASCPSGASRGLYNCVANSSFISAVGRADAGAPMTVAEAMEAGLIDGSWPIIPSSDLARNQDPFCYTYGFCHTNLVKMRKARIISVGWELAAESIYNSDSQTVTLQEVVDGFNDCEPDGTASQNHKWCKLIDPNWVLKYPETQCKAMVNGQLLVASGSGERQQECVDMPSCIAENDNGTCTGGYGYCVKEENIWRFRGEVCPEQFASCLTFEGDEKTASFLQTTVDYADCNADNAGCLWYDTVKVDADATGAVDGVYDWQVVDSIALADADTDAYKSRVYFTKAVEECSPENGGCSELVQRNDTLRLNVIQNSSFEDDTNNDTIADGWIASNASVVLDTTGTSRSSAKALNAGAGQNLTQPGIAVSQGRFYTLSFYARQKVDGAIAQARSTLEFLAINSDNDINLRGTSFVGAAGTDCQVMNSGVVTNGDGLDDALNLTGVPQGTAYERFSCTFTAPTLRDTSSLMIVSAAFAGDVFIDDVQLEQGEDASTYHAGYSTFDLAKVTVKVPPSYLGCQGSDSDPAECKNYAQVCSENEVGCTAYTPTNGDPTVTGVASELDACPAVCSGYDTFMQEPTLYEPAGNFPVYFIPTTGQTCAEEQAGCDEFTNLTNEALEDYVYLRACVTTAQANANIGGDNSETFYTWEGSDLAGYQLKTWQLLESNLGDATPYTYVSGGVDENSGLAPCSLWTATPTGIVCADERDTNGDFKKDWDTVACDDHNDIFTNPDCREFYDTNGGLHYRLWSKTVTVDDACTGYRKTELVGVDLAAQTANCTNSGGFFDAVTGVCRYNGLSTESISCPASANGCRSYTGGRSRNSRVVLEDTLENGSLNNWDARSAADVTLSNESLATGGHSIAATNNFSTFIFEDGCTDPAGCASTTGSLGGTCTVVNGENYCGTLENELFQGKTYTISFWAKGSGTLTAGFDLAAVAGSPVAEIPFGTVTLTSGWQEFSLGPLNITAAGYPNFGTGTTLAFDPSASAFIDNITLREGEDNITLIKDSWTTPAVCDQSPTGASSPQYYLGCQEYRTQNSETAYLKSFSRLCSSDKVGCEDFFMTHESTSPYAQVFQATCSNIGGTPVTSPTSCYYKKNGAGGFDTTSQYLCTIGVGLTSCDFNLDWYQSQASLPSHISYGPSTTVIPADSDVFLVVNDGVTCNTAEAGCQEVGKPRWSQDRNSTTGADSVFLLNDPDQYNDILCNDGELFCEAWNTNADGQFYFKDPGDQTCDYRTGVQINGTDYNGWFRAGTNDFCYGTCSATGTSCSSNADCTGAGNTCDASRPSYVINGKQSGVWKNGDTAYGGWVGQCGAENSTCSEFQDPLDLETDERYQKDTGKKYFYLNNDNLDQNVLPSSQKCNGQASLKQGCVLFNDTSEPSQGFSSSATEVASRHADQFFGRAPYSLVDPIDCEVGDSSLTLPDSTTVDLCAERCIYDKGEINDVTSGVTRDVKLQREVTNNDPGRYGFNDLYLVGTSCFDVADCGTMRSESGLERQAIDCNSSARVTRAAVSPTGVEERTNVKRLENDTNTILKVNRDRQCSEWLACSEDQASWDERTSSFKTVCSDLTLCTEYSSVTGGNSFCSKYKDNEAEIVLDRQVYMDRDTSWYGQEYSGYAIPGIFPVQTLEQANVAPPPNHCDFTDKLKLGEINEQYFNEHQGDSCTSGNPGACDSHPDACVSDDNQDFRLSLVAGTCGVNAPFGQTCSVGFCKNNHAACSSTADCSPDGGDCVVGLCQTVQMNHGIPMRCTSDNNCAEGDLCSGGVCVTPEADVTVERFNNNQSTPNQICPSGQDFADNIDLLTGTCIRGQCLLTPDGKTYNVAKSEGKICRAYPESNSPFADDLVTQWLDPVDNTIASKFDGIDNVPYSTRTGFENANFCAPGEDCSCSYKKLTYEDGGQVRYWDNDSTVVNKDDGLCSAGKIGVSCKTNVECDTAAGSDGVCADVTKEDTILGLDGYCLEKDSGININGDRDQHACLTWLPVDQLAGSTDLYAKFTEAGYFEDTYACTYVSPYVNLRMSKHPEQSFSAGSIACAAAELGDVSPEEAREPSLLVPCAQNLKCPDEYWALMGMPAYKKNGQGTMADACAGGGTDAGGSGNDCPFVCIPKEATTINKNTGELTSCDFGGAYVEELLGEFGIGGLSEPIGGDVVRLVGGTVTGGDAAAEAADRLVYQRFDETVDALKDCSLNGVEVTAPLRSSIFTFPSEGNDLGGGTNQVAYHSLVMQGEFYAACKEVARVSGSSPYSGYAWTDRLIGPETPNKPNAWTINNNGVPGLDLSFESNPGPYGFTDEKPTGAVSDDHWPLTVATCQDFETLVQPQGSAPFNECDNTTGQEVYSEQITSLLIGTGLSQELQNRTNPSTSTARSFVGYNYRGADPSDPIAFSVDGDAFSIINQLFAGINLGNNRYAWNQDDVSWPNVEREYSVNSDFFSSDQADVRADKGNPPKVWSLDSGSCVGTQCEEGDLNSLTINDRSSGDHSAFDFVKAYLKFYAAADENQLPIRRVIVDWGDSLTADITEGFQGSSGDDNFYKNHRGLDEHSTTSICNLNKKWGQTSESCDPNYFSYSHVYTCSAELLNDATKACHRTNGRLDFSPCHEDNGTTNNSNPVCVYQPRVHIRDNWGWCTGVCVGDGTFVPNDDNSEGCFEGDATDTLGVPNENRSECGYQEYPANNRAIDPWVYYDGEIFVDPLE